MLIFGHRGMPSNKVTENTLMSFLQAVQAGVDGIEFDVRCSKDGELVIIHDDTLVRVAGDARRVEDLTHKELQAILLRGAGNIPTLNDITTAIPATVQLDIEIKDLKATELIIAKLKTSAGLRERTIISSFHIEALRQCLQEVPDVRRLVLVRAWSLRNSTLWQDAFSVLPWGIGTRIGSLNESRIRWLRSKGVQVAAYEDRSPVRAAKKMAMLGVDLAITYRPDVCKASVQD
ncbi:MAG: glycerophosphodiester phosphodiesterase family protein [Patescibacteria group bacterium]